jgi:hypothetical protein
VKRALETLMDTDRNLHFCVLALEADVVTPSQFVEAPVADARGRDGTGGGKAIWEKGFCDRTFGD